MWILLFLVQVIGFIAVDAKATNMCFYRQPNCSKGKLIKIKEILCPIPNEIEKWLAYKHRISETCESVKECDIEAIRPVIEYCCGDGTRIKPKLRFSFDCPIKSKATPAPKSVTTKHIVATNGTTPTVFKEISVTTARHIPITSFVTFPEKLGPFDSDFCSVNICMEEPYCTMGTKISIIKFTANGQNDWKKKGMIGFYCNKKQRCSAGYEEYVENFCQEGQLNTVQYVCMKEKLTTQVECNGFTQYVSDLEGNVISYQYPDMVSADSNKCIIKISLQKQMPVEIFMLEDGKITIQTMGSNGQMSPTKVYHSKHMIFSGTYEVVITIDPAHLNERRLWLYYRALEDASPEITPELPWMSSCHGISSTASIPAVVEVSKVMTTRISAGLTQTKVVSPMHKPATTSMMEKMSSSKSNVLPEGLPVTTESTPQRTVLAAANTTTRKVSMKEEMSTENPHNHENLGEEGSKKNVINTDSSSRTGMFSREVITGLIAGVVILACLVVILMTALVASMRRRRRSLAANEDTEERNSGTGGTSNEPLASFQYLKTNLGEGDNGTLSNRPEETEESLVGDYSKTGLISKPFKKKNSLVSSGNESGKTMDSTASKEDNVFNYSKNGDETSQDGRRSSHERNTSVDLGIIKGNTFTGRKRSDVNMAQRNENQEVKGDDEVFRDVQHFYVNGDDYALVQKNSRSPKTALFTDRSGIYSTTPVAPKSGSSGSIQDSDVLEWTKGFNLAV